MTSKEYMTQVTAIDPYWMGKSDSCRFSAVYLIRYFIAELGSVFYSVKEKNFDDQRGTRRKADREFSKKAELEMQMAKEREQYVYSSRLPSAILLISYLGRLRRRLSLANGRLPGLVRASS
jgi:hypothetical protein